MPLLVRTWSPSGQEKIEICVCSVSQDLKSLQWVDQEGEGKRHEVPFNTVVAVDQGDSPNHIELRARRADGETKIELMWLAGENSVPWRKGLQALVANQHGVSVTPSSA